MEHDVKKSKPDTTVHIQNAESVMTKVFIGAGGLHPRVNKCTAPKIKLIVLPSEQFNRELLKPDYPTLFPPSRQKVQQDGILHQSMRSSAALLASVQDIVARAIPILGVKVTNIAITSGLDLAN